TISPKHESWVDASWTVSDVDGYLGFDSPVGIARPNQALSAAAGDNDNNPFNPLPWTNADSSRYNVISVRYHRKLRKDLAWTVGYTSDHLSLNDYMLNGVSPVPTTAQNTGLVGRTPLNSLAGQYTGLLDMNTLNRPYDVDIV